MPGKGPCQWALCRWLGWQGVSGDLSDSPAHLVQTDLDIIKEMLSVLVKLIQVSFTH